MPRDDLFDMISSVARDEYFDFKNPTGVIGMAPESGYGEYRDSDIFLSSDSNKKRFLMGISVWGADSAGNSDLVGE
jgi:hypothetical protein